MNDELAGEPVQDGRFREGAPSSRRAIFRAEARRYFIERQDKVVLPRLYARPVFLILWIAAVLLMAAGALIVFWPLIG